MEENFKNILNRKHVTRGLLIFSLFTLIGFLSSFLWKGHRDAINTVSSINFRFLVIVLMLIFVDWILMGYRIYIFASCMSKQVGFWDCFKANLANTCIGAITPSQTGGWAGQLYIIYRAGISLAGGTAITVITFLLTLFFFFFSAILVIILNQNLYSGKMAILIEYCFIMFIFVFAFFIFILLKPNIILKLLSKISSLQLVKSKHRFYEICQKGIKRLEVFINDYKVYTELFIKRKKRTVLLSMFVTFVIYFNKYITAYVIAKALDNKVNFWSVIFIQVILTFISYFSPTPGASGISEFSATFFMSSIMHQGTAIFFTPIWRFSTTYLELFVGGFIIIYQIRQDILRNAEPKLYKQDA